MEPDETADDGGAWLRAGLAAALKDALQARDPTAASALRTTLSAIANAEAVATGAAAAAAGGSGGSSPRASTATQAPGPAGSAHFAGALAGLGAGEVARRRLSASDVTAIVRAEIAEREAAAAGYQTNGLPSQAERLRTEARVLTAVIAAANPES